MSAQAEDMFGGRFVLGGGIEDIRNQFKRLWESLASKLPPPSDAVRSSKQFTISARNSSCVI